MKKIICFFAIVFISLTAMAQISNTSNTVTFDVNGTDCATTPAAGSYTADLSYFDFWTADWVYLNDIPVTVSVSGTTFTVDASSVTPAVNFPTDEGYQLLYSTGHLILPSGSTEYHLIFDYGYLNCQPLGMQKAFEHLSNLAW
jgi:hypothetical protein